MATKVIPEFNRRQRPRLNSGSCAAGLPHRRLPWRRQAYAPRVRLAGVEPATLWFEAKYSIQMSYSRFQRREHHLVDDAGAAIALMIFCFSDTRSTKTEMELHPPLFLFGALQIVLKRSSLPGSAFHRGRPLGSRSAYDLPPVLSCTTSAVASG